jgi:hypothetical protein
MSQSRRREPTSSSVSAASRRPRVRASGGRRTCYRSVDVVANRKMTEAEATLLRFLITRFREACAYPSPGTLETLGHAIMVGLRRVRGALEAAFSDPDLGAADRRDLLVVYNGLDRLLAGFQRSDEESVQARLHIAAALIRRLEQAYARVQERGAGPEASRGGSGRDPARTELEAHDDVSGPVVDFEDRKTQVFTRAAGPDHAESELHGTRRFG